MVQDERDRGGWKRLAPRDAKDTYRSIAYLEPFELSFDRAQAFYMMKLDFTLRSPDLPDFGAAFSVGRMRLTRIELEDGTVIEPPANAPAAAPAFGATWDTAIRFSAGPKNGPLATPLWLMIDTKAKPDQLKALRGTVTLRFPRALETMRLDDLRVGRKVVSGAMTVTVTGRGRKSVTLEASRDGDKVIYVQLMNAEGQPVAFSGPQTKVGADGAWSFELFPGSACTTAAVVVAEESDTKEYPFVLSAR
jgi:hypothetical protein